MRRWRETIGYKIFLLVTVTSLMLTGCGSTQNTTVAPENLQFDESTGKFSFDALDGASTYLVGVSKVLNDTTGEKLLGINGSALTTLSSGEEVYLWSEQSGSATGIADNDGDGIVDGTVIFRAFSSSAEKVGEVLSMSELPLGHYIVQAIASSSDELPNPESSYYEFVKTGTLALPEGFVGEINESGQIQITAPSGYYLSCLTATGLPSSMVFEVSEGGTVVETITVEDFSYTNSVLGPAKSYNFNHETVTGTTTLDKSKDYDITVTAVGDGDGILDASAAVYLGTSTEALAFSTVYDTYGTATAGIFDVNLQIGLDAAGGTVYELTGSISGIVIYRESGTYTTENEIENIENFVTYAEGAVLTFATSQSDISNVMDGVTMNVVCGEKAGAGMPPVNSAVYNLAATGLSLNGNTFDFEAAVASFGMP